MSLDLTHRVGHTAEDLKYIAGICDALNKTGGSNLAAEETPIDIFYDVDLQGTIYKEDTFWNYFPAIIN